MKCPFCGHDSSRVIDSRPAEDAIRRRRQCEKCGKRFTTYENLETFPLMVIKKDDKAKKVFHKFSVVVWAIWLIPYVLGMFIGMK